MISLFSFLFIHRERAFRIQLLAPFIEQDLGFFLVHQVAFDGVIKQVSPKLEIFDQGIAKIGQLPFVIDNVIRGEGESRKCFADLRDRGNQDRSGPAIGIANFLTDGSNVGPELFALGLEAGISFQGIFPRTLTVKDQRLRK